MDLVLNLCLWDPSAAEPSLFTKEVQQSPEMQAWNLSKLDLKDFLTQAMTLTAPRIELLPVVLLLTQ